MRLGDAFSSKLRRLPKDLLALLDRLCEETGVPGISVAYSIQGHRFYVCTGSTGHGTARMRESSRFDTGCLTRFLLSLVALELASVRRLNLDAPIGEYLPELSGCVHGQSIKTEHLLSRTGGYKGLDPMDSAARGGSWPDLVEYLRNAPQYYRPGTVFNDEHSETALLSMLLERLTGNSISKLIESIVLSPLGIDAHAFHAGRDDLTGTADHVYDPKRQSFRSSPTPDLKGFWRRAFAAVSLTPKELLDIAEVLLGGTSSRANCFLSPVSISRLRNAAVLLPSYVAGPLAESYPLASTSGMTVFRDDVHGIGGSSHGQCIGMRVDSRHATAVAVAVNARVPHIRDLILNSIQEFLSNRGNRDTAERRAPCTPNLSVFEGEYHGTGRHRIVAKFFEDSLELTILSPHAGVPLVATVTVESNGQASLSCPVVDLAIGFLNPPRGGNASLMLGLTAFRKVSPKA